MQAGDNGTLFAKIFIDAFCARSKREGSIGRAKECMGLRGIGFPYDFFYNAELLSK
jgi:hypothetical protein